MNVKNFIFIFTALSKVLKSFTCAIKYLDLDSTGIDDRGFIALVTALSQRAQRARLPPVSAHAAAAKEDNDGEKGEEEVDIKKSPETTVSEKLKKKKNGETILIEPLPSCLVEIHLGHNMISDVSHAAFDMLVDSLPQLTHLDLSWNRLKERTALTLSQRVSDVRCPLSVLNLQFNRIGNFGASALLRPLSGMPTPRLEVLDLSFNGITLDGDVLIDVVEVVRSKIEKLKM